MSSDLTDAQLSALSTALPSLHCRFTEPVCWSCFKARIRRRANLVASCNP
jgi:hypothetical protein